MNYNECIDAIYQETMSPDGFLFGTRENKVDVEKFEKLKNAISQLTVLTKDNKELSKLVVACLFGVPWELENTVPHYKAQNADLAKKVSSMAEELNNLIQDLLWSGLEEYYK